ncbi:class I SAM-dependent methyltransferase [Salibaculum griseiflavum]|uniref:Class I SAM-dependent methyltransferase n=1 Tax=Salibaculum griseiflavum TaxID=1914409 RepID=A0A2V1P5W9_9RHOB|nr:class I SAM-dependent methyltransferase [Salibaculum griseiflavum]PWG17200.1 class I SAM-dependent methyltransferase [Salibaculum griseiflavum]
MSEVRAQYEAYPYPERDPADESKRLISGSPSDPREIDHFVFGGKRDWARPLRVLVAGGGTGDGLIQLAQMMAWAGKPAEITYLDLSTASRDVAEARAKARGLTGIRFETGSLLDAAEYGRFDYIDCCGVLHHLPDPAAGFAALRAALAPGGGLGFMVYAPYGRSGVYPLQTAFGALLAGLSPQDRLARAKEIYARLPEDHPFKRNRLVGDHEQSDAGFYDLLLHSQDRAFAVDELLSVMAETGWQLSGFVQPALYDPSRLAGVPEGLDPATRMAVAEQLRGTFKVHVGYAVEAGRDTARARPADLSLIPHLKGGDPAKLARMVGAGKPVQLTFGPVTETVRLPKRAARLIAGINGKRTLAEIARGAGLDPLAFGTLWAQVDRELGGFGLLLYSGIGR